MKKLTLLFCCLWHLASFAHAKEDIDFQALKRQYEATPYVRMMKSACIAMNKKIATWTLPDFQKGEHGQCEIEIHFRNFAEAQRMKAPYPQSVTFRALKNAEPNRIYEYTLVRKHWLAPWTLEKVTKRKKTRADKFRITTNSNG